MFQSHVIELDGTFIGAAVRTTDGFRFWAVHPKVDELDGFSWKSIDELRQATAHLYRTGRLRAITADGPVAENSGFARM